MAKTKTRSGLGKFNIFLFVVFIALLVATILIIAFSSADSAEDPAAAGEFVDEIVIDEFKPGTYGGKEFKTQEDLINYYVECYNYTKTLTAQYDENGEKKTYYKLIGVDTLDIENLLVEGKSNSTIDKLVPGIVGGLFSSGVKGLTPSDNRDPNLDTRNDGALDLRTSALTNDDILAANIVDNKDGTVTITIQPKAAILSMPGEDSQGRFFNVLGDISGVVSSISVLSFSEGTIDENFVVNYAGGTGVIKIDTKTGEVLEAEYVMKVHIDVQHANVAILKDKSASLDIVYKNVFPASDEDLMELKGIKRLG